MAKRVVIHAIHASKLAVVSLPHKDYEANSAFSRLAMHITTNES